MTVEQPTKRQVVLDTETTGLSTLDDHRIIEIGCVELVNRRLTGETFHQYINPERKIDVGAMEVHGITDESLLDKPKFSEIADDFMRFIAGAELIIHNASFDVGFLDHELAKIKAEERRVKEISTVLDTLKLARDKHPGQKNDLNALCRRYEVDNSNRELHGALLDAEILADIYLAMTGGQVSMLLATEESVATRASTESKIAKRERRDPSQMTKVNDKESAVHEETLQRLNKKRGPLRVIKANSEEWAAHEATLQRLNKTSNGQCVWLKTMD